MILLCVDSAAKTGSVAVVSDNKVLSEGFVNTGLTHSQTLVPMINEVLKKANITPRDIDAYAVTRGPGSFTGLRIGMATVMGMASATDKPCIGVSTLHALSLGAGDFEGIVCAAMDARREQVYFALFKDGKRLTDDSADSIQNVLALLKEKNQPTLLVGDGAHLCYDAMKGEIDVTLADEEIRFLKAGAIAKAVNSGEYEETIPSNLRPIYLRLPQAERELKAKRSMEKC